MAFETSIRASSQVLGTALLCLSLSACGGGDAPSAGTAAGAALADQVALLPVPATAAAPAASANLANAPAATRTVPPSSALPAAEFSCGLNGAAGIEAEVMQRINVLRASGAVCGATGYAATGALVWNAQLLQAARGHSADMAQKNYFGHISQDGRTAAQRVTAAGYNWSSVGENIAAGQRSVEEVMTGWAISPGHCQNLMNPNYRDVAVACVRNDAADYRLYWTMALGRSR